MVDLYFIIYIYIMVYIYTKVYFLRWLVARITWVLHEGVSIHIHGCQWLYLFLVLMSICVGINPARRPVRMLSMQGQNILE